MISIWKDFPPWDQSRQSQRFIHHSLRSWLIKKELSYIYGCIDVIPYVLDDTEYLMMLAH